MTKSISQAREERVNLRQLAQKLHLSQTTISLVLNDSPGAKSIPPHTRERVIEAARKYNYRPNYFARSLRQSKSMSVGILAPDLSEGFFTLVILGVEEHLIKSNYFYFTASHYWKPDLIKEYPRMLMERAVDGFLVLNTQTAISSTLPVVAIASHNNAPGVVNIVLDHTRAAELALRHLYKYGHRRIAFMQGPASNPDSAYRWQGILQIAAELGITIVPELCLSLPVNSWSPQLGYDLVSNLLQTTRNFTALFCFNDIAAIGAMRAIQDAGLSVPGDISVIGFDDIVSAAFQRPSLTTVRQPLREMGREGAKILLDLIANPGKQYPAEVVMQPELLIRESTGRAPRRKPKVASV